MMVLSFKYTSLGKVTILHEGVTPTEEERGDKLAT